MTKQTLLKKKIILQQKIKAAGLVKRLVLFYKPVLQCITLLLYSIKNGLEKNFETDYTRAIPRQRGETMEEIVKRELARLDKEIENCKNPFGRIYLGMQRASLMNSWEFFKKGLEFYS